MTKIDFNLGKLFRWKSFDNRLLCILNDENVAGDEVSCFTELNDDLSIKKVFNDEYKRYFSVTRFLPMEDVIEIEKQGVIK